MEEERISKHFCINPLDQSEIPEANDFPKFPMSSDEGSYADLMRKTLSVMEDWVYEHGFNGSYRMTIGQHLAFSKQYQTALNSRSKNPFYSVVKSIIDLVIRFSGRDFFTQYTLPPSVPLDDEGRIRYCLTVYKLVLQFLKTQGAFLSHVYPIYMLDYDDYVYYKTKILPNLKGQSEYMIFPSKVVLKDCVFECYSLQSWLDIILQLYKVLILYPTIEFRVKFESSISTINKVEGENSISNKSVNLEEPITESTRDFNINSCENHAEQTLLSWLNSIFQKKRTKWLQLNPKLVLPLRVAKNFTTDLIDCVILITITSYYCPYLTSEYFSTVFFDPKDPSQCQHNASCLSLAWVSIHLGVSVSAIDFRTPNPILMILIVNHLFTVMRSYVPENVIHFSTCLNSTMSRKFLIYNPSGHQIGFYVKKIGDPHNCFTITPHKHIVTVPPKKTTAVTIKFFTRSINKVKATIVLCGSGVIGAFASNIAFSLEGEPKKFQVKNFFNFNTPLFKAVTITVGIVSPFSTGGIFEIWYSEEELKPEKRSISPWRDIKHQTLPRCLYINSDTIELFPTHAAKPGLLSIVTASYTMKVQEYWLLFRNPTIGDFITKIQVVPRIDMPFYTLSVPVSPESCTGVPEVMCISQCPKLVMASLPARNNKFWSTVNTMLSLTMNKKEKAFWSAYLEKPIGLKLVRWMLSKTTNPISAEIDFIFTPTVTYKVECTSALVECPATFTINDVHSDGTISFPLHVKQEAPSTFSTNIKFTSENKKEIRLYHIIITTANKSTTDLSSTSDAVKKK